MRFLFRWQHVDPGTKLAGPDGLREIVAMLDGFELPAAAWERSVLSARLEAYDPSMLDMLCLTGEVGWLRLSAPAKTPQAALTGGTPVALFLREHADAWRRLRTDDAGALGIPPLARRVLETLRSRGASFFNDLGAASGLESGELREGIGALVAAGLAASDGFAGLRALIKASRGVPRGRDRRAHFAGRWTASSGSDPGDPQSAVETQAWTLLRRYGVVFRRLLTRETNAAPWRELTRVYRRLEARGEIRGGRFVSGMSGEQFALPEAVERLREIRRTPPDGRLLTIVAADPLNLVGIVTPGDRIRGLRRTRIVFRDGVPLGVLEGDAVRELTPLDRETAAAVARALGPARLPLALRR
jgi:ATP-dependent Lhr-like helicase